MKNPKKSTLKALNAIFKKSLKNSPLRALKDVFNFEKKTRF